MAPSPFLPYIAIGTPFKANPRPFVCLSGLLHAADELLNQMPRFFADSVGACAINPSSDQDLRPANDSPHYRKAGCTTLRTPKLSVLGFASLLLGISSTLMLFGSLAFFVGFMLMPLILPASIAVCVGAALAASKKGQQEPTPASWEAFKELISKISDRKAWF